MNGHAFVDARNRALRPLGAALAVLASAALLGSASLPSAVATPAAPSVETSCSSVPATVQTTHQINVVLDDSGSMFVAPSPQRWSYVKYALMVFAAMLGPTDRMKVFLLSERGEVALTINGSAGGPSQANVDAINALQMQGGGTPWAAVPKARDDLARSDAESRWLVIMSDGDFDGHAASPSEFSGWAKKYGTADQSFSVGFLGAGSGAPQLNPASGFYPANAPDDIDKILDTTADLANQIFGRAEIEPRAGSTSTIDAEIDLATVLVLAQGKGAIGAPMGGEDQDQPFDLLDEPVRIPLPSNAPARANGTRVDAVAANGLTGQVATVADLPAGPVHFDVGGASQSSFYYVPRVQFGVTWVDPATGQPIPPDQPVVAGSYQIQYGFMDAECRIIGPERASLLGEVTLSATMTTPDGVVTPLENGASYDLSAGDVVVTVDGSYLGGNPAHAAIQQHVFPAPEYGDIKIDGDQLAASSIGAGGTITATYTGPNGRAITAQEWDAIDASAFTVTAEPPGGLEWTVEKGARPGEIVLTPVSATGNVYDVDTSQPLEVTLVADYVFNEGIKRAEGTTSLQVVDDLSWLDRFWNWFTTWGWMVLAGGLLLLLIIGYVVKKRFNRKFKPAPHINARPKTYGMPAGQSRGEFKRSLLHQVLPFVADRATLRYAPGTAGFTRLQLKAAGRGVGEVTNWKALVSAYRPDKSVEINGTRFDKDMTKPPKVGPGHVITAQTPDMKYECAPGS